jgi:hypothetical protein
MSKKSERARKYRSGRGGNKSVTTSLVDISADLMLAALRHTWFADPDIRGFVDPPKTAVT